MTVCKMCLMAIESHEGNQVQKRIGFEDWSKYEDDDGLIECEWCEEKFDSDMHII